MNIAIIFVGELRWFDLFQESFQANVLDVLQEHNIHYFAHFWNNGVDHQRVLFKFSQLYSPITLDTENPRSSEYIKLFFNNERILDGTLPSQSYSFYKAYLLLQEYQEQHKYVFDLYIKLRTDLVFLEPISLKGFDKRALLVDSTNEWAGRKLVSYINDYLFFTHDFINIQKLANIGFHFDKITLCPEDFLYSKEMPSGVFCPEEVLAKYIQSQNINIETYSFKIDLARHYQQ